jgi:hypothetical protein
MSGRLNENDKILVSVMTFSWHNDLQVASFEGDWSKVNEALQNILGFLVTFYREEPDRTAPDDQKRAWRLDLEYLIEIVWESNKRTFEWFPFAIMQVNGFARENNNERLNFQLCLLQILKGDTWRMGRSLDLMSRLFECCEYRFNFYRGCKYTFQPEFISLLVNLILVEEKRDYVFLISKNRGIELTYDVMKHINSFIPSQASITYYAVTILSKIIDPLNFDVEKWKILSGYSAEDYCFIGNRRIFFLLLNQDMTDFIMKIKDFEAIRLLFKCIGWIDTVIE